MVLNPINQDFIQNRKRIFFEMLNAPRVGLVYGLQDLGLKTHPRHLYMMLASVKKRQGLPTSSNRPDSFAEHMFGLYF